MRGLLGAYGGNAAQALAPKTRWPAAASAARRPTEPPQVKLPSTRVHHSPGNGPLLPGNRQDLRAMVNTMETIS